MTNTDKKITINGNQENFEPVPFIHPQPFIQPQCVSPHVIPSQTDVGLFSQEVRVNKLENLEVSMTYHEEEFYCPLKRIDGDYNAPKKSLLEYFEKTGIIKVSPVFKLKLLDMLKIDAALMKDGYYPFFINCYNNNSENSFEEVHVVHDFCKYQLALSQKHETEKVSRILSKHLEGLLSDDNVAVLTSLTMKRKNGLVFWMSNFVPKIRENKFLNKLFEFEDSVSDCINVDSKENDNDDFDFFEHVIEVSDCVVRFTFLSEINVMISLEKAGETISFYTIKIDGNDILVERDNEGE